jgi:hypothetical protein
MEVPPKLDGNIALVVTLIVLAVYGAVILRASGRSDLALEEGRAARVGVAVLEEREDNHYEELSAGQKRIEQKLDTLLGRNADD